MTKLPYFSKKLAGKKFFFRPILPSDKEFLQKGFQELSAKSKYLRFFAYQTQLSESQLRFFTEVDGKNHVAWGVMDVTDYSHHPAGTARFVRDGRNPDLAEVAITIVDKYQRIGLGRIMLAILNVVGAKLGIKTFRYHVMPDNLGILKSLEPVQSDHRTLDRSVLLMDAKVIGDPEELKDTPKTTRFREVLAEVGKNIASFD